ncbi:MAG: cysteine--tRNA ligase [Candidatus Vogelbacteria bacterium]|nr:cysteine--tRNA ligase [Candidatus Vogelbacteria bacterium]
MDIKPNIKLFNTLSRETEKFAPIKDGKVGLYLCGPTVYDYATIGNYRTYIFGDLINRIFSYNGYKVKYVQNITDVGHLVSDEDTGEDKLEKGARREGKTAREVADYFTKLYWAESDKLNIKRPTISCRATDHIPEQIEMIKTLEEKGFTYKTSDGIYFDTSKQKDYGKLATLDIKGLKEGARVEANPEKKNITDFALWKFSPKNENRHMEWEPPWGIGFPGWHIECSAMSIKYLDEPFDMHAGAVDLIPVHHTNEIAQNEAIYGHKTVNYWLHGGFLMVDGKKMGKSLGNAYKISDITDKGFDPLVFRYLTFNTHYRQPMNFTWEAIESSKEALSKLYKTVAKMLPNEDDRPKLSTEWGDKFLEAINDDLNMPKALAVVWELVKNDSVDSSTKLATLYKFDEVLGLDIKKYATNLSELMTQDSKLPEIVDRIKLERDVARQKKDWQKSDKLRRNIEALGYRVEDIDGETKIYKI